MKPLRYARQLLGSVLSRKRTLLRRAYLLPSRHLGRDVMIDVYRPALPPWRLNRLVLFNDGQDLDRMSLQDQLRAAYTDHQLPPTIVVGIHAGDRMREYGTVNRPDYQGRGDQAGNYERFLLEELIPYLENSYNIFSMPNKRAIAGFSLGGLSAFDLAWRNPGEFGNAGVFSGSLWWRDKPFHPGKPDADLIVHGYVRRAKKAPKVRYWFMAGTRDETADRNNNGIIDAIDDTLTLLQALENKGKIPEQDFTYVEVENGTHDPETWGTVVLDFLRWL